MDAHTTRHSAFPKRSIRLLHCLCLVSSIASLCLLYGPASRMSFVFLHFCRSPDHFHPRLPRSVSISSRMLATYWHLPYHRMLLYSYRGLCPQLFASHAIRSCCPCHLALGFPALPALHHNDFTGALLPGYSLLRSGSSPINFILTFAVFTLRLFHHQLVHKRCPSRC